jgi:hypothetical protein
VVGQAQLRQSLTGNLLAGPATLKRLRRHAA